MWRQLFCILPLILTTLAIKVPVDNSDILSENTNTTHNSPAYYSSEDADVDSYLIPPNPHKPEEVPDDVATPATYLLPPSPNKQTDYYYPPTESDDQGDWYPIAPQPQIAAEVKRKPKTGKLIHKGRIIPIPSDHLEPPVFNAPNDYALPPPSEELELPVEEAGQQFASPDLDYAPIIGKQKFNPVLTKDLPVRFRINPGEPILASHLVPPKPLNSQFKSPTKLYPKKYSGSFKPVPNQIMQFAEDGLLELPRAKPVKIFNPNIDNDYVNLSDEKKRYLFEQTELKRKLKEEEAAKQLQTPAVEAYGIAVPIEQETSETLQRYPGRPAPLRQTPAQSTQNEANVAPPSDDRTEFRMHGMKGPHSYQFGYDTGKGKNRQFRFEERDNDGFVKGHYGYMDKSGKLRVVNYRAHPEHGFEADAPVDKE